MRPVLILVLAAATGLSVPAAAQEPGPELERTYFRTAAGPRALSRLTDCLINRHPQDARAMFDHVPGSSDYDQAAERFYADTGTCAFSIRRLGASGLMIMGSIAEHLIREDGPARPLVPEADSDFMGGGTFRWDWRGLQRDAERLLLPLSQCLLARHGESVDAVLAARPNANGERKAYNAMRAEIADCIPVGEERVLQPQQLRAALAETYYRAARAAARANGAVS